MDGGPKLALTQLIARNGPDFSKARHTDTLVYMESHSSQKQFLSDGTSPGVWLQPVPNYISPLFCI